MGMLQSQDDGQKPLARKYFNQLKKDGIELNDRRSPVEKIKLSSSEEWLIIECADCIALMNTKSKAVQSFCETVISSGNRNKAAKRNVCHTVKDGSRQSY